MKSWKKLAVTLAAASAGLIATGGPTPAEAQTYTLYCRGGGPLDVTSTLMEVATSTYAKSKRVMRVEGTYLFKPGRQKYSPDKLGAGHCTWADRGMRKGEPTRVVLDKNIQGVDQKMTFRIRRVRSSVRATKKNGSPIPYKELSALDHLLTTTKVLPFRVRKVGGKFEVQQVLEPIAVKGTRSGG